MSKRWVAFYVTLYLLIVVMTIVALARTPRDAGLCDLSDPYRVCIQPVVRTTR